MKKIGSSIRCGRNCSHICVHDKGADHRRRDRREEPYLSIRVFLFSYIIQL
ncbi:hypothetical protein Scep_015136 [Stephania cephalantha]|uniref:Uncharacterized protein n=1 Tax=Stephania cephalantha TaxID=152367 RepID=A0AAP0J3G0_9MAGN